MLLLVLEQASELFFFFFYFMQWLDVGSHFPDQGLNLGGSDESTKSYL